MKKTLIASFTSRARGAILVLACVLGLLTVQAVFAILQRTQIESTEKMVQSVLRQEINVSNTFLISRAITDLQHMGLISCTRLYSTKTEQFILDLSYEGKCSSNPLTMEGRSATLDLKSLNGEIWKISFLVRNGAFFGISLWLSRFLASALTAAFVLWLFRRFDREIRLRQEKEQENRSLQETVMAQEIRLSEMETSVSRSTTLADHAARIAHDIRSPLSVISMLSSKIGADSPAEAKLLQEAAKGIIKSAERLLTNVGGRGKPSGPSEPLSPLSDPPQEPLDGPTYPLSQIESLCHFVSSMKQVEMENAKRSIRMSIYSQVGGSIGHAIYDPDDLQDILSNLVNNSIESIQSDGFVNIDIGVEESYVKIEIRDSGEGIPELVLEQIGQRPISHGKTEGHGLGLFNACRIISVWGGNFKVLSTGPRGTTIQISLPLEGTPHSPIPK